MSMQTLSSFTHCYCAMSGCSCLDACSVPFCGDCVLKASHQSRDRGRREAGDGGTRQGIGSRDGSVSVQRAQPATELCVSTPQWSKVCGVNRQRRGIFRRRHRLRHQRLLHGRRRRRGRSDRKSWWCCAPENAQVCRCRCLSCYDCSSSLHAPVG